MRYAELPLVSTTLVSMPPVAFTVTTENTLDAAHTDAVTSGIHASADQLKYVPAPHANRGESCVQLAAPGRL